MDQLYIFERGVTALALVEALLIQRKSWGCLISEENRVIVFEIVALSVNHKILSLFKQN